MNLLALTCSNVSSTMERTWGLVGQSIQTQFWHLPLISYVSLGKSLNHKTGDNKTPCVPYGDVVRTKQNIASKSKLQSTMQIEEAVTVIDRLSFKISRKENLFLFPWNNLSFADAAGNW